jgi:hypothetical protein
MSTKPTLILIAFAFIASNCFAQLPKEVTRTSNLIFKLEKKEVRTFFVIADSADIMGIQIGSKRPVNVSIKDPNGAIKVGKMVSGNSYSWLDFGGLTGVWEITFENLLSFSKAEMKVVLAITKTDFIYGSGEDGKDSLLNDRAQEMITKGRFRVKKDNPLSFPVSAQKGDTLLVFVSPESGKCPKISITNDAGEWLNASIPAHEEKFVTIPVLADGAHDVAIDASSLFGFLPSPFKQVFDINIIKHSPKRHVTVEEPRAIQEVEDISDTISEIYLDTIILLGAARDIIHANERVLKIKFKDPESILYWVIVYGSGTDFTNQMAELNESAMTDPKTGIMLDPLEAYARGKLKSLPKNSNNEISFIPSEDIIAALNGKNYGRVDFFNDNSSLKMVNKSKSVGRKIQVKVLVFRSVHK